MAFENLFASDIPTPVAPVRTVSGVYNGQPVIIDGMGNMTSPTTGNLIAVAPGSQADIGTSGTPTPATVATTPTASTASSGITGLIAKVANATSSSIFGISLEDIVFILVGLILIAAGVFSFKSTGSVINVVTKGAKKAAEVAA